MEHAGYIVATVVLIFALVALSANEWLIRRVEGAIADGRLVNATQEEARAKVAGWKANRLNLVGCAVVIAAGALFFLR